MNGKGPAHLAEVAPPQDIHKLLDIFTTAGGVIDFVFFELPNPQSVSDYELHYTAAVSTLEALRKRFTLPPISIQAERAIARGISVAEFLGAQYDPQKGIKLYGEMYSYTPTDGYAQSFFEPPYAINSTLTQRGWTDQELFREMNKALFNDFEALSICEWSTDWSSYFDAGKEWWGAHLCTVANPTRNLLIGIGASSTD
ncbi:MAG TPA: hypothetical protein VFW40_10935 [Capsulimonadaceae bacterium]|nr:hypothetical protein [Capsulimonadaceae bacterium]